MSGVLAANAKVVTKADRRTEFLHVIQHVQKVSLETEPGNLCYVVGQDLQDPNTFFLHEQYGSPKDHDHHLTLPHAFQLIEFTKTDPLVSLQIDPFHNGAQQERQTKMSLESCLQPSFRLNVTSFVKPEFRDGFLHLMKTHQANSLGEPGCIQFDWGESTTVPNTFHMHEQYRTKADYDFHESTPHFAKFKRFNAQGPYEKPQIVDLFRVPVDSSS